jgi:hypothetical protein
MTTNEIQDVVHGYYRAWAERKRAQAQDLLHDDLVFVSPQDTFSSSASFLSKCWKYSAGLAGVEFVTEVYQGDSAFVILRWLNEDGTSFADAEYLRVVHGRIAEILVVNNDPAFSNLLG